MSRFQAINPGRNSFMFKGALPMYKLLFFISLFTATNTKIYAQPVDRKNSPSFEYYICISGINSRQDVEYLQNIISKKPGIYFFMANRYPVRYFSMRSDHAINSNEFEHLLNNRSLNILFYGEGKKGREQAVIIYNKSKAR